jgi:hypothetical protein
MSRVRRLLTLLFIDLVVVQAGSSHGLAASTFDPAHRFRTLTTSHFVVYFHQGEDRLAARLATIAEDTWHTMRATLGAAPPDRTHVVLTDHTELANGSATPLPYNTIVVTAVWPGGAQTIGRTDDWLRLVFTHEFTHILHLDRSEGWAKIAGHVFGRLPVIFPNLFLPQWHIEGIATYEESAITGEGRLNAGDFRQIVDEGARAVRFEPLDRTNGGLTDWPGGAAAYAYGAGFHAYLADRFGTDSFARLTRATAGRVPFTAARVFERIYGRSLGALWRDYEESIVQVASRERTERPSRSSDADAAHRVTYHGFIVTGPRFTIDPGCPSCPPGVVYSVENPHEFPAMYELASGSAAPRRLVTRYLGATTAVGSSTIYFDQLEFRRSAGLYSDLYALDRRTGRVSRLTTDARLLEPDLAPDGNVLVCVRDQAGQRDLVVVNVTTGGAAITDVISEPDTQFNAPRWSPDGRTIVVERHVRGRQPEIAIVDRATRRVHTVAASPNARVVTPAWRPDGRAIVAAADLDEGSFDLYEIDVDPIAIFSAAQPGNVTWRRLTHANGGALWPDISADGRMLIFVGYTTDGFDLFEMPYPDGTAPGTERVALTGPSSGSVAAETVASEPRAETTSTAANAYQPLATLAPTSWSPILEGDRNQLRLGFATGGVDALRYHSYGLSATWPVTKPHSALTPDSATPDWQVGYQYTRWQPTIWFSAASTTSFFAGPADDRGVPSSATLREHQLEGGIFFPIRHARVSHSAVSSLVRSSDDFALATGMLSRTRVAWRSGWGITSARTYGYSISPEDGIAFAATADLARRALGSSADASTMTADGRVYWSPFRHHQVIAIRLAGGVSMGDATVGRTFHLGGAQSNVATLDFGRNAISLLRGFGSDTFAGSRVALMNADYRWPLARPQRGHGTWPFFLHTIHAAAFADVGHAWNRRFDSRDLKSSLGGELSFDVVAGYSVRFTTAVGAAWGRDGSRSVPNSGTVYVRLGHAF